jgi:hypothetical protein
MDNKQRFLNKKLSMEENNTCVQFVTTGERPQNSIKNTDPQMRFMEYPKMNAPPVYIKEDLKKMDLSKLGKFDVILVDPPWE